MTDGTIAARHKHGLVLGIGKHCSMKLVTLGDPDQRIFSEVACTVNKPAAARRAYNNASAGGASGHVHELGPLGYELGRWCTVSQTTSCWRR
jgi:hypothetical protein